jgi:RHS repeat-associated protein
MPRVYSRFLCVLCAFALLKRSGWTWRNSIIATSTLAFGIVIVYSYFIEVPEAGATYTRQGIYYYSTDHLGRPFNVWDGATTPALRWYERHYPFGETILDGITNDPMEVGGGTYLSTWKPNLRFPGQCEDDDMGTSYNSRSFLVQNHYREYMPRFGRYNRVDPLSNKSLIINDIYYYCLNSPQRYVELVS